jgi:ribosomal protein L37AE/L43A
MDIYTKLKTKSNNEIYINRYIKFIDKVKNSGNIQHHILPKAKDMWPEFIDLNENSWNECKLGHREHFIAHWMLWKILGGSQTHAFFAMKNKDNQHINSKTYQLLKENISHSNETCEKISNRIKELHKTKSVGMYGKKQSDSQKQKVSKKLSGVKKTKEHVENFRKSLLNTIHADGYTHPNTGLVRSAETRKKISQNHHDVSGKNNPMYGRKRTTEEKKKLSIAAKNRQKMKCIHCGKLLDPSNHKRWHGDNCKRNVTN